jgi:molecular chaperone GrpE
MTTEQELHAEPGAPHAQPSQAQPDSAHENAAPGSEAAGEAGASTEATMQAATARIQELESQVGEFRDKWVRAEAELQNLRARAKRELEDARQYTVQKFARDIVEAAENLQRGLASLPAKVEGEGGLLAKLREGFESTERSFLGILERHGVTAHHPAGQPFDANLHQAMAEQPSAEHPAGTVIQAWTPSWLLHGRLLKPAMVVVSKGGPDAKPAETTSANTPS